MENGHSNMTTNRPVAVITGGNAGVGLTLADRLLNTNTNTHICLVCRNKGRAENAKTTLQTSHPQAQISIILMDTSNIKSVFIAAREIKGRFHRLDYLYCNAGIMPVKPGINWDNLFNGILEGKAVHMFTTGEGLLSQVDETTAEGLRNIFATNLFGHFVLFRELEKELGGTVSTQVIWTSSNASKKCALNTKDIQHSRGNDPYGSSKCAIDALSIALNEKYNKRHIYSHTTSPGLVLTNLTNGIFPQWFWYLCLPFFWLMRLFVETLNLSAYNGSEALVWLPQQKSEQLDPSCRFESHTNFMGKPYVSPQKLDISSQVAEQVYEECDKLYQKFKNEYDR